MEEVRFFEFCMIVHGLKCQERKGSSILTEEEVMINPYPLCRLIAIFQKTKYGKRRIIKMIFTLVFVVPAVGVVSV